MPLCCRKLLCKFSSMWWVLWPEFFLSLQNATVLAEWTGLRPWRSKGVRLERETRYFGATKTYVSISLHSSDNDFINVISAIFSPKWNWSNEKSKKWDLLDLRHPCILHEKRDGKLCKTIFTSQFYAYFHCFVWITSNIVCSPKKKVITYNQITSQQATSVQSYMQDRLNGTAIMLPQIFLNFW